MNTVPCSICFTPIPCKKLFVFCPNCFTKFTLVI